MRSSAASNRPQGRPALPLAAVALTALALAVLVAFASTLKLPQRASRPTAVQAPAERFGRPAPATTAGAHRVVSTAQPVVAASAAEPRQAPVLWTLLTPWALGIDALALAGLVGVLALRGALRGARR